MLIADIIFRAVGFQKARLFRHSKMTLAVIKAF
jgi:hypothetical protein